MCYNVDQAQSYLRSYDKVAERALDEQEEREEREEREDKFCEECGTTLDLQEDSICLDCLEEAENIKYPKIK